MTSPQRVDVERLSELLSRATPGPYEAVESDNGFACIGTVKADASGGKGFIVGEAWSMADAEYVAAALNALPALLQQLAEQRDELATLQVIHNCLRRDHERSKARAEAAERTREEACAIFAEVIDTVRDAATDARMNHHAKRGEYHDEMADRIAAFLAANGGRDEA